MRSILRRAIANSQRRESFLTERRIHLRQIQEAENREGEADKENRTGTAQSGQKG
jgi:hypothetical protein